MEDLLQQARSVLQEHHKDFQELIELPEPDDEGFQAFVVLRFSALLRDFCLKYFAKSIHPVEDPGNEHESFVLGWHKIHAKYCVSRLPRQFGCSEVSAPTECFVERLLIQLEVLVKNEVTKKAQLLPFPPAPSDGYWKDFPESERNENPPRIVEVLRIQDAGSQHSEPLIDSNLEAWVLEKMDAFGFT